MVGDVLTAAAYGPYRLPPYHTPCRRAPDRRLRFFRTRRVNELLRASETTNATVTRPLLSRQGNLVHCTSVKRYIILF
ncbi:unnamed protein product, partial [Brenthis ino]